MKKTKAEKEKKIEEGEKTANKSGSRRGALRKAITVSSSTTRQRLATRVLSSYGETKTANNEGGGKPPKQT